MIRARRPADCAPPRTITDPEILDAYLEDASGVAPGRAAGLVRVESEAEASAFLRGTRAEGHPVLFQAARSSLTAGAVPAGETVLSVERMTGIGPIETSGDTAGVRVDPGVRLIDLESHLAERGYYYPPAPTHLQAMVGGVVSTNAGGAASFKYGVTRDWVRAIRVVLSGGDVLDLERGQCVRRRGETFPVVLSHGARIDVPVPEYELPALKKISAGYHAADPMDLVDLFIGAEGTLGLITSVTLGLVPLPPSVVTGLVFLPDRATALSLATELRAAACRARDESASREPDVRAIESLDEACLKLLVASGSDRARRLPVPAGARFALLFELELPTVIDDDTALEWLAGVLDGRADVPDGPLPRLYRLLARHDALEHLELAFPEDDRRREDLRGFREAVPIRVGEILAQRRRADSTVSKVGGDLIVPFDRLEEMIGIYERGFASRGLEYAIWGHLSDGNLHPNVLARDAAQMQAGVAAVLEFADEAIRRGGAPLSEHGVGRSPLKQRLLRRFLGDGAVESMRRIKGVLDPSERLAPGVLFPRRSDAASAG